MFYTCWQSGLLFCTLGMFFPWLDTNPLHWSSAMYHIFLAVAAMLVALGDLFWPADLY